MKTGFPGWVRVGVLALVTCVSLTLCPLVVGADSASRRSDVVETPPLQALTFKDCDICPEMVAIPGDDFMMGSFESERHWAKMQSSVPNTFDEEAPVHRVSVPSFAIGKYEVTYEEFIAFVADTRHVWAGSCIALVKSTSSGAFVWKSVRAVVWRDALSRQDTHSPVVCVSWEDARSYVGWLSQRTGQDYRLPSEAEWEYAARGGTQSARYWGNDWSNRDACRFANANDETSMRENGFESRSLGCDDGYARAAPVGTFRANAFGLHDMLGNAEEWVEDCLTENYKGAPTDGSAWVSDWCTLRVVRGGAWASGPRSLRSAARLTSAPMDRLFYTGFRVAKTLSP